MDNISKIVFNEMIQSFKAKKYEQTIALINKLLERKNQQAIICYLKAYSLYRLKEEDEAILLLSDIVDKDKKFEITIKSAILLGYMYIKKRQFKKAKELLMIPVQKQYEHSYHYSLLGYIAHEEGDYEKAEKLFQKCLSLDSENPTFNNNLGYNYLVGKGEVEKAEPYIQKAFKKDGENVNYIDSLGWLYFMNKNVKKSKQLLEKALHLKDNVTIKQHYKVVRQNAR